MLSPGQFRHRCKYQFSVKLALIAAEPTDSNYLACRASPTAIRVRRLLQKLSPMGKEQESRSPSEFFAKLCVVKYREPSLAKASCQNNQCSAVTLCANLAKTSQCVGLQLVRIRRHQKLLSRYLAFGRWECRSPRTSGVIRDPVGIEATSGRPERLKGVPHPSLGSR